MQSASGWRATGMAAAMVIANSATGKPPTPGVDVGGHRIHIECDGVGSPTVVFESGIGGSSAEWADLAQVIRTTTRACRYDRCGYRPSGQCAERPNAQKSAAMLAQVLGAAGERGPYVIVAHSYGGFIARVAAVRGEIDVRALVLLDTSHEDQFERIESKGAKRLAPTTGAGRIGVKWNREWTETQAAHARVRARLHANAALRELKGFRRSAKQVRALKDSEGGPESIVLWRAPLNAGPRERTWAKLQASMAQQLQAVRAGPVAGAGHAIHVERPDVAEAAIIEMVERVRNRNATGPMPRSTKH